MGTDLRYHIYLPYWLTEGNVATILILLKCFLFYFVSPTDFLMYLFFAFVYFTFCFSKLKIYFDIVALCTQKKNKKEGLKREQENVFNTQRCQMKIIKIIRNCLCFFYYLYQTSTLCRGNRRPREFSGHEYLHIYLGTLYLCARSWDRCWDELPRLLIIISNSGVTIVMMMILCEIMAINVELWYEYYEQKFHLDCV